jgi:hypothetical protein
MNIANIGIGMISATRYAPPRLISPGIRSGSSGFRDRASMPTKVVSSAAAATNRAIVEPALQPTSAARVNP